MTEKEGATRAAQALLTLGEKYEKRIEGCISALFDAAMEATSNGRKVTKTEFFSIITTTISQCLFPFEVNVAIGSSPIADHTDLMVMKMREDFQGIEIMYHTQISGMDLAAAGVTNDR